jgi:hypothetical protein
MVLLKENEAAISQTEDPQAYWNRPDLSYRAERVGAGRGWNLLRHSKTRTRAEKIKDPAAAAQNPSDRENKNTNGGALREKPETPTLARLTAPKTEYGPDLNAWVEQETEWIRTKNHHRTMKSSNPKIEQNRKNDDITQDVKIKIFH